MDKKRLMNIIMICVFVILIIGFYILESNQKKVSDGTNTDTNVNGNTQLANPASVNCIDKGGTLSIVDEANGQVGYCHCSDGLTVCEEWAYLRGECACTGGPDPIENKDQCSVNADCIPLPSECHPHSCINKQYENNFIKPEACTMMFDNQAAYTADDCACVNHSCINKNLNK